MTKKINVERECQRYWKQVLPRVEALVKQAWLDGFKQGIEKLRLDYVEWPERDGGDD